MPTERYQYRCLADLTDAKCLGLHPNPDAYRCSSCKTRFATMRAKAIGGAISVKVDLDRSRSQIGRKLETVGVTANRMHLDWTAKVESIYRDMFIDALAPPKPPPKFALCICGSLARREACPYSDIDSFLILKETSEKTLSYFQQVTLQVNQSFLELKGEANGFRLCTDLNPQSILETPEGLIEMLEYFELKMGDTAAHELSVKEARFLYGDLELFQHYEKLVARYKKANRPGTVKQAKKSIGQQIKDMTKDLDASKADYDTYLNIKGNLYRVVQVVLRDLAAIWGIEAPEGRTQVLEMVKAGRMSVAVSNLAINLLEDIGKLRLKAQLDQGQHGEGLYLKQPADFKDKGPAMVAKKVDVEMVAASRERLLIWKRLAEDYLKEIDRFLNDWQTAHANRPKGIRKLFAKRVKVKRPVNPYLNENPRKLLG
jgi:hypothetical protein